MTLDEHRLALLARRHRVSVAYLRMIAEARLDDAAAVEALRTAAQRPPLWALVNPAAKNALIVLTAEIQVLGGTLDQLLKGIAAHGLKVVTTALDMALEEQRDAAIAKRHQQDSARNASNAKTAAADRRAKSYLTEIERRPSGQTKNAVILSIANREHLTPPAIKKVITEYKKRSSTKK